MLAKCATQDCALAQEPADLVRLLALFISTTNNPNVMPTCSMGEVLAASLQPRAEVLPNNITPGPES